MSLPVVHGLQAVHVDERGHQVSFRAPCPVDLALELLQPDAPPARPRQVVGARVHALVRSLRTLGRGTTAIARGVLTILRRPFAVIACAFAPSGSAGKELIYAH